VKRISMRRAAAYAGVLVALLALTPSAFAHAELFPNQIPSGDGYLLNLAVPNEKDTASTTQIQITMPAEFDLEHVAPVPGWTAAVAGQKMVNGEMQGGTSITWKGRLRGTALAVLPFTGVPKKAQDYAFTVRQTYSDGSVVVWSGDESSDTPAAHITATAAASGSGGSSDSGKTIAIIALVVGGLGLLVGAVSLVSRRRAE
jgi:periplasmic copper chaperone A